MTLIVVIGVVFFIASLPAIMTGIGALLPLAIVAGVYYLIDWLMKD